MQFVLRNRHSVVLWLVVVSLSLPASSHAIDLGPVRDGAGAVARAYTHVVFPVYSSPDSSLYAYALKRMPEENFKVRDITVYDPDLGTYETGALDPMPFVFNTLGGVVTFTPLAKLMSLACALGPVYVPLGFVLGKSAAGETVGPTRPAENYPMVDPDSRRSWSGTRYSTYSKSLAGSTAAIGGFTSGFNPAILPDEEVEVGTSWFGRFLGSDEGLDAAQFTLTTRRSDGSILFPNAVTMTTNQLWKDPNSDMTEGFSSMSAFCGSTYVRHIALGWRLWSIVEDDVSRTATTYRGMYSDVGMALKPMARRPCLVLGTMAENIGGGLLVKGVKRTNLGFTESGKDTAVALPTRLSVGIKDDVTLGLFRVRLSGTSRFRTDQSMRSTQSIGSEVFLPVARLPVLKMLVVSAACGADSRGRRGVGLRTTVSDLFNVRVAWDRYDHTLVSFGCAYRHAFGPPREEN
jgi:hypothetical protein